MKHSTARAALGGALLMTAVIGPMVPTSAVAETLSIMCKGTNGASPWSFDVDLSAKTVLGARATITDREIKWSVPALNTTYVLSRMTGILSTWDNGNGPFNQECEKATKKF